MVYAKEGEVEVLKIGVGSEQILYLSKYSDSTIFTGRRTDGGFEIVPFLNFFSTN